MGKCVLVREDDPDLIELVRELLTDAGYAVIEVTSVDDLLREAALRAPCVALVDGSDPSAFDLWWLGPKLTALNVPPVAFTAHLSAFAEFARDAHGYVGVIGKPFDASTFIELVDSICFEEHQSAVS